MWLAVNGAQQVVDVTGVANQRRVRAVGAEGSENPPAPEELGQWRWEQSELSSDLAGKLGFALGSASASSRSRALIAEFSRSAIVESGERRIRFGVAARLVVSVANVDAKASLTIPVVAAEGQISRSQASVNLTVDGYVGPQVAALMPTHVQTLNVDTYSSLLTAMSEIVKLIGSDNENIRPQQLWIEAEDQGPAHVDAELSRAVGMVYGLSRLRDQHSLDDAIAGYNDSDDHAALEGVRHVYADLLPDGDQERAPEAASRATRLLDDYVIEEPTGVFRGFFR